VRADTRNMAVRRRVFASVQFNEEALRGEDIQFGMEAEAAGFRVAAWPEMRAGHLAESRLDEFLARRMASGWALRKLALERPELDWPAPFRRRPARSQTWLRRTPGARPALRAATRALLAFSRP